MLEVAQFGHVLDFYSKGDFAGGTDFWGKSLARRMLSCEYQEVREAGDNHRVSYYEARLCTQHSKENSETFSCFLKSIRNKKMMAHITLDTLCHTWKIFAERQEPFSIPFPIIALQDKPTYAMIESLIRNTQSGNRVILEVSESEWMEAFSQFEFEIGELKNLGVRFLMNGVDASTAFFESIKHACIDMIKFDGTIWNADKVLAADENGLLMVASGIETHKHYQNVYLYGIHYVQGNYFHVPKIL